MVIDTGGVITVSKSQANVMEELAISTTIGMDGIPLASREAAIARMPSMIERQATAAVEESAVILFVVDGQVQNMKFMSFVQLLPVKKMIQHLFFYLKVIVTFCTGPYRQRRLDHELWF